MELTDYYNVVPYCEDLKYSLQWIPCKIFKYDAHQEINPLISQKFNFKLTNHFTYNNKR